MSATIPPGYVPCRHCAGLGVIKRDTKTSEHFAAFWSCWPSNERKQDKAKCLALWRDRHYDRIASAIMADLDVKKRTQKWQTGFIEAPLVYLRNRRWEDGTTPDHPCVNNLWTRSEQATLSMAASIGIVPRPGEEWEPLRSRIAAALRDRG